jgi:hypothetical protein
MRTIAQIAVDIDRTLRLNLNNREFQTLCGLLGDDPEKKCDTLLAEGREAVLKQVKGQ